MSRTLSDRSDAASALQTTSLSGSGIQVPHGGKQHSSLLEYSPAVFRSPTHSKLLLLLLSPVAQQQPVQRIRTIRQQQQRTSPWPSL